MAVPAAAPSSRPRTEVTVLLRRHPHSAPRRAASRRPLLVAALLAATATATACKKAPPPAEPPGPGAPPVLPSPEGSHYALGADRPVDGLVAHVVDRGLLPWSESLSGAATTLALDDDEQLTLEAARWAAIRAGYPHPVVTIVTGIEPPGAVPEELLDALGPVVHIGDHLGLVRARSAAGDQWVALVGRPGVDLDPFPREYPVGASLQVTGHSLSPWVVVSPSGAVRRGGLPVDLTLDQPGEWWLEFQASPSDPTPRLGVPLYVGVPTPKAPTIVADDGRLPDPSELRDRTLDALFDVRTAFGLPEFTWDATLASLAATPVQQVLAGTWDAEQGVRRLRGAGFIGGPAAQLACTAPTVSACVTHLVRHADARSQLLLPGLRLAGVAGEVRTSGVTLVINLSSE